MRTVEQVREDWRLRGITLASWARANGHKPQDVRDVLRRRSQGNFGAAFAIAVQLGLRPGIVDPAADTRQECSQPG